MRFPRRRARFAEGTESRRLDAELALVAVDANGADPASPKSRL
jgi:hypothetical protein